MSEKPLNSWETAPSADNQSIGAKTLASMPTFEELSKEDRPEGVRDEQDYREYLAEREAKRGEYKKADQEIMDGIRRIEDLDGRNLATAMLAVCYNKNRVDEYGERDIYNVVGMEMMRVAIECINTHKEQSDDTEKNLNKAFRDLWGKYYNHGNGDISKSNAEANIHDRFNDLIKGQRIENMSSVLEGTEVEFDFPDFNEDILFGKVELVTSYSTNKTRKVVGPSRLTGDRLSALALAYSIKDRFDQNAAALELIKSQGYAATHSRYSEGLICVTEMKVLRDAFHFNIGDSDDSQKVHDGLQEIEKKAINRVYATALKEIQDAHISSETDFNSLRIPVRDSGIFNLAIIQSVKEGLSEYEFLRKKYDEYLEKGQQILDGEDWKK